MYVNYSHIYLKRYVTENNILYLLCNSLYDFSKHWKKID